MSKPEDLGGKYFRVEMKDGSVLYVYADEVVVSDSGAITFLNHKVGVAETYVGLVIAADAYNLCAAASAIDARPLTLEPEGDE